jgi:hypothetical protein
LPFPRKKQSKLPNARDDNNRDLLPQSTPGPKVALQADKRFRFDAALPLPKRATGLCEINGLKAGRQITAQKQNRLTQEVGEGGLMLADDDVL